MWDTRVPSNLDSVIRIMLLTPPGYRWAGEDDHFNKTKYLRLKSSKQKSGQNGSSSPAHHEYEERRLSRLSCRTPSPTTADRIKADPSSSRSSSRAKSSCSPHQSIEAAGSVRSRQSELEKRNRINKKYSNIRIRQPTDDFDERNRPGYDRLFSRPPSKDYPYANPVPKCLLTEENIDNLRDIIVDSAREIEWKLLTPIRPESDYEEKFFDKLIELHRCRYKTRLELGYFDQNHLRAPFKYTRHRPFMIQYRMPAERQQLGSGSSSRQQKQPPLAALMKRRHSIRGLSLAIHAGGGRQRLTIPALTLTTSDNSDGSEPLRGEICPDDSGANQDQVPPASPSSQADLSAYSYERFSRFSKKNQPWDQLSSSTSGIKLDDGRAEANNNAQVDEQLDEIVSHLMLESVDEVVGSNSAVKRF